MIEGLKLSAKVSAAYAESGSFCDSIDDEQREEEEVSFETERLHQDRHRTNSDKALHHPLRSSVRRHVDEGGGRHLAELRPEQLLPLGTRESAHHSVDRSSIGNLHAVSPRRAHRYDPPDSAVDDFPPPPTSHARPPLPRRAVSQEEHQQRLREEKQQQQQSEHWRSGHEAPRRDYREELPPDDAMNFSDGRSQLSQKQHQEIDASSNSSEDHHRRSEDLPPRQEEEEEALMHSEVEQGMQISHNGSLSNSWETIHGDGDTSQEAIEQEKSVNLSGGNLSMFLDKYYIA